MSIPDSLDGVPAERMLEDYGVRHLRTAHTRYNMMTMNIEDGRPRQLWHAGFIVDNLEEAMSELSAGIGLSWNGVHEIQDQRLDGPDGASWILNTRVVFSLDLPLSIELIEPSPGTPNVRRGDSAFHHLGFWSEDLVAEEDRLGELGYGCIMFRTDETDLRRILVTEGPYDILLEATNTLTSRPGLEHFYPGGSSR